MRVPQGTPVSFDAELEAVSRLRGLPPRGDIQGLRVPRQELLAHVEHAVKLERPEVSLEGTEAILVGLGLVPVNFDFEAIMLQLLSTSLAGLYEPRLKMMLLRSELPPAEARVTLLHELVHALQDQHFDLDEVVAFHDDDSDVSSAISSLAEGDATSAMMDGILPDGQTALDIPEAAIEQQFFSSTATPGAPGVVVRSLFAPYLDGLRFVNSLRRRGGWEAVNEAWKYSPKSTEQILHLDKYEAREEPIAVDLPTPPTSEWRLLFHDIWGEQSLRIVLEDWLPRHQAERAAAGWGGDRIAVFERGDQRIVAWNLVMDSAAESRELLSALHESLKDSDDTGTEDSAVGCGRPRESQVRIAFLELGSEVRILTSPFRRDTNESDNCSFAQEWLSTQQPSQKDPPPPPTP